MPNTRGILSWRKRYATKIPSIDAHHQRPIKIFRMLQEAIHHRQVDDEVGPIPEFLENYSRVPFEGEETCNQLHAVPDPWPNAFLETPKGTLKVAWVPPNSAACPAGVFRQTGERVLLGFSNGALRLHMLRQGDRRSERPTEHLQWLKELEIPGSEG